jgi:enamine deaminase RidA (YjgF/YER057c/UK114 family)
MPVDSNVTVAKLGSRLRELGLVLPKPPTPLGAYVEVSKVGSLLFLSGTLPLVDGKLAISGVSARIFRSIRAARQPDWLH